MIKFKDFLHIRSTYSDFVDNEDDCLTEGLIKSYPLDITREYISRRMDFLDIGPIFDESSFNVLFKLGLKDDKQFVEQMNEWLFKFGYFVSHIKKLSSEKDEIVVSIEMKYPINVDMVKYSGQDWYHITNSQYIDKIKKIGLGPRGTTTMYNHPPDRIYISYAKHVDKILISKFANDLYINKLNYLKKSNNPNKIKNWQDSTMVLLRINLDNSYKVYFDPMFAISPNYIAGFTEKYIGPDRISSVEEISMIGDIAKKWKNPVISYH